MDTAAAASGPPLPPDSTRFLSAHAVERRALPKSAPDPDLLQGMATTGLAIRLRVYIEADGSVARVETVTAAEADREASARLGDMLRRTAFIPARLAGRDVASYTDLELRISDLR